MWRGFYGDDAAKHAGIAYLEQMARIQEFYGASFLDVNVDEFSNNVEEHMRLIQWVAGVLQHASALPLSIDSSDLNIRRRTRSGRSVARQTDGEFRVAGTYRRH